jgi:hypothetical protein
VENESPCSLSFTPQPYSANGIFAISQCTTCGREFLWRSPEIGLMQLHQSSSPLPRTYSALVNLRIGAADLMMGGCDLVRTLRHIAV